MFYIVESKSKTKKMHVCLTIMQVRLDIRNLIRVFAVRLKSSGGSQHPPCRQRIGWMPRPRGSKTFFMLYSIEHKIFPAHKC